MKNKVLAYFNQVDDDVKVYASDIAEFFSEDYCIISDILDDLWCEGLIDSSFKRETCLDDKIHAGLSGV